MFKFNGKLALLSRVLVTLTPVGNRKSDVAFFGHTVTVDHDGTRQRYFKKLEVGKRCYSVYEESRASESREPSDFGRLGVAARCTRSQQGGYVETKQPT